MRGMAHHIYAVTYRAQAFVGLALVAWMIASVPGAVMRDDYIGMPLSVAVITGVVSLALLWPYLTPSWIAHPTRLNQLIPVTLAHLIFPLLYGFVCINAMIASATPAFLANQMAVAVAIYLIATSAVCVGLGMWLCFTDRKAANTQPDMTDNVSVLVPLSEARPKSNPIIVDQPAGAAGVSRAS